MVERKYFPINEKLAKDSLGMWSFSEYKLNSATESYQAEVNKAYNIVDKIAEIKPNRLDEALQVAEKYSRSYVIWIDKKHSIDMQCPSVMICGGANFPVKKKEKQNAATDKHYKDLEYINGYMTKLENILHGQEIIKSGDSDAIEKLQEKLTDLERLQTLMKSANSYYKKNNSLDGFEMSDKLKNACMQSINSGWSDRPFPSYSMTNNNAKLKATKDRLESLQKVKETPTQETIQTHICQVVENTELMRIQLVFEGKPDEEVRSILKSNGFKWSPTNGAWQRQLTDNARYSTKKAIKQLEELQTA